MLTLTFDLPDLETYISSFLLSSSKLGKKTLFLKRDEKADIIC